MSRTTLSTVLTMAMVLLAGCAGGFSGTPAAGEGLTPGDRATLGNGTLDGGSGTVDLYISDQPAAIEDFEHLNVTISTVGFKRAGVDDAGNETKARETEVTDTEMPENGTDVTDNNQAGDNKTDADDGENEDESDDWIEHEVDGRVADLTALRGDNATLLGQFDVRNGTYTTVFVDVSAIEATLENGESVNVKLPSQTLRIHERFRVANGSQVDFVFDIAVHKAGNSGKYVLRPVISESGTDVPINPVDEPVAESAGDGREANLEASFVGAVSPDVNATIEAMSEGAPSKMRAWWSSTGGPAGRTPPAG